MAFPPPSLSLPHSFPLSLSLYLSLHLFVSVPLSVSLTHTHILVTEKACQRTEPRKTGLFSTQKTQSFCRVCKHPSLLTIGILTEEVLNSSFCCTMAEEFTEPGTYRKNHGSKIQCLHVILSTILTSLESEKSFKVMSKVQFLFLLFKHKCHNWTSTFALPSSQ